MRAGEAAAAAYRQAEAGLGVCYDLAVYGVAQLLHHVTVTPEHEDGAAEVVRGHVQLLALGLDHHQLVVAVVAELLTAGSPCLGSPRDNLHSGC